MRTIPNSNLNERKRQVLRIHQDNLKMIEKLAQTKPNEDLAQPTEAPAPQSNMFTVADKYRSRSAQQLHTNRVETADKVLYRFQ